MIYYIYLLLSFYLIIYVHIRLRWSPVFYISSKCTQVKIIKKNIQLKNYNILYKAQK